MPSSRMPLGVIAVTSSPGGWSASIEDGQDVRSTAVLYASPIAALVAISGAAADEPWLIELADRALEQRQGT